MIKAIWEWINRKLFFQNNRQLEVMEQSLELLRQKVESEKETRQLLRTEFKSIKQMNKNIASIRKYIERQPLRKASSKTTEMITRKLMDKE